MKALYITLSAIVVGIIAYLLARSLNTKTPVLPAPKGPVVTHLPDNSEPAAMPPAPGPIVTPVVPVPVTNRVIIGTDGNAYNTTLPAPYNTMPVSVTGTGSGTAQPDETRYFMYKYKNSAHIWAVPLTVGSMTDADVLAWFNSFKPSNTDHQFVINQSGKLIKGSF